MAENRRKSVHTLAQFKVHKSKTNHSKISNVVEREFDDRDVLEVIVSDLTYVRVNGKWNYICLITDLYNREILGYSAGAHKMAKLLLQAFASINHNLNKIKIFHTDRESEFKNSTIEDLLYNFNIQRSLSKKVYPYDNVVV